MLGTLICRGIDRIRSEKFSNIIMILCLYFSSTYKVITKRHLFCIQAENEKYFFSQNFFMFEEEITEILFTISVI